MALSQKGEALKAQNLANQKAFEEPTVSASVTPAVANIGGQPTVAPIAPVAPVLPVDAINPSAPTVQMQADTAIAQPPAPVTPVSAPVVPATMKEPVATAPVAKVEAPKFMTDVQRREQLGEVDKQASRDQMIANVGIMAKEDAGVLTDRAKFNAKTSYDTKPPEEKAILDTYFNANTPTTTGDIKKQLFAGVEIKDPKILNTPAYRQAKFEKDRLSRYTGMSSEQLFNEMKNGLPTVASEALRGTPAYTEAMAKYDNFKKVDNINQTSKFLVTGKSPEKDPLAELSNQLTNIFGQQDQTGSTAEAYRSFISQNPEITEPTAEYNTKMAQKKEFERARESLVEDLKKKYAGEPLSTILSIAARESKPINDQINTLNDSLTTLGADIKFKTDLATQEFGFYTQDQQAKSAKQAKLQDLLGGLAVSQFGREQDQAFTRETQAQNQQFDIQKMDIQNRFQTDRDTQNYMQDLQKMGINNIYDLEKMTANQDFQKELLALNQKYSDSKSVRDFNNELYKLGLTPPTGTTSASGTAQYTPWATDFTGLATKYPWVAAFKNNNPAGITWNANFDNGKGTAKALADAGIQFEKGTNRPASEGGNYVKFNSIEDGIAAQRVMLEKTYGNSTVGSMLSSWVGTKEGPAYAKQVAGMAGISTTDKVSDLSTEQLDMLQLAKLKKESPGLYNELSNAGIVDGNTINFSKASPIGFWDALASDSIAWEFARSIKGGTVTGMTGKPKELLPTDKVLFDKFLSGNETKEDELKLRQRGFTLDSVNQYASQLSKPAEMTPYTDADIALFNSTKYNPQTDKDAKRVDRYNNYVNDRAVTQSNPDADIFQLMKLSRGQTNLGQSENKAYKDINTVVGQLGSLNKSIDEFNKEGMFGGTALAPIAGAIAQKNPWDTKAQGIQAQLQALVPKVARGIFGEVGVLTDQDIANYMKTLPNIKQTADVQDVVQFALLDTLKNALDSAIAIDSATYDISGISGKYKKLNDKIEVLRNKIVETPKESEKVFKEWYIQSLLTK